MCFTVHLCALQYIRAIPFKDLISCVRPLLFVAENIDHFRFNLEIHGFNTKNKSNLHLPPSKLTVYQRGPYYSGIKAFNKLPTYVKNLLQTRKEFKRALKEFLYLHSFYSLNEFYNYNRL